MGLLQPTDGSLEADGQAITSANNRIWQAHIAHVPQAIFLPNNSFEENIAFGAPKDQIDNQSVREAATNRVRYNLGLNCAARMGGFNN